MDRFRRLQGVPGWAVAVPWVFLAALPWVLNEGTIYLAASIAITVVLGLSLTVCMGLGGYFSLAQGAQFGLGAFVVAVGADRSGVDLAILLVLCGVGGAAASAVMALICWRTSHLYLAMVTLAFGFILADFALNWRSVTGGGQGLSVAVDLFGRPVDGAGLYLGALVLCALTVSVTRRIRRNSIGRSLALTRTSEPAARAVGIDTGMTMVGVFASSGALAAMAGGLFVAFVGFADPSAFDFNRTVTVLTLVVLAGLRSPVSLLVVAPVLLYAQHVAASHAWSNWLPFGYAVLVVVVLMSFPQGAAGMVSFVRNRLQDRTVDARPVEEVTR